jgi:purine-binding chemotaxis protein CheW
MRRADELGRLSEYLTFSLAGDAYGVHISYIREILKPLPITEVPRAAPEVLGIMSVRGRLVTVMEMRRIFRLPRVPQDRHTRIFLVEAGDEENVGFLVDEVLQVYRLADTEIEPPDALGGEQPAHIVGVGRPKGGPMLVLLDLKPILGAE